MFDFKMMQSCHVVSTFSATLMRSASKTKLNKLHQLESLAFNINDISNNVAKCANYVALNYKMIVSSVVQKGKLILQFIKHRYFTEVN